MILSCPAAYLLTFKNPEPGHSTWPDTCQQLIRNNWPTNVAECHVQTPPSKSRSAGSRNEKGSTERGA